MAAKPFANLDLAQSPPLGVPGRFFLTAPLFGMAAAALLWYLGPAALQDRSFAGTAALTHLLTIGFLTMTMCGAWFQLLPVLTGAGVERAPASSRWVHGLLGAGAAGLPAALFLSSRTLLFGAGATLAAALLLFLAVAARALARAGVDHDTVRTMRLALAGLVGTLLLGLGLVALRLAPGFVPRPPLAVHVAWASIGWVGLLVVGVGYQVVPMFQLTPAYPHVMRRFFARIVFALLVLYLAVGSFATARTVIEALMAVGLGTFAATTLWLQGHRRRRVPDVTFDYWRLAMASLLAAASLWLVGLAVPGIAALPRFPVLVGALYLVGFAVAVVSGMLYKIVPFLVWLHLHAERMRQGRGVEVAHLPNTKQVVPEARARGQWRIFVAGYVLLLVAIVRTGPLVYLAAAALLLGFARLALDVAAALRLYRRLAAS